MFGLKTAASNDNLRRLKEFMLPGEGFDFFSQLSTAYIGVTSNGRVFAHEIEKANMLEGTLYVFNLHSITGLMLYHRKAALVAGEGFGLMLGTKEIILLSGDRKQCKEAFLYLQELLFTPSNMHLHPQ